MYSWEAIVKLAWADHPCSPCHLVLARDDEPQSCLEARKYLGSQSLPPQPCPMAKGEDLESLDCVLFGSLVSEDQVWQATRSLAALEKEA